MKEQRLQLKLLKPLQKYQGYFTGCLLKNRQDLLHESGLGYTRFARYDKQNCFYRALFVNSRPVSSRYPEMSRIVYSAPVTEVVKVRFESKILSNSTTSFTQDRTQRLDDTGEVDF